MKQNCVFIIDPVRAKVEAAGGPRLELETSGGVVNVEYSVIPADPEDEFSVPVVRLESVKASGDMRLRSMDGQLELSIKPGTDIRQMLTDRQMDLITERIPRTA